MQTNIIVKWDLEGTHCWPNAPDEFAILRSPHSHIFRFVVHIPVTNSRQLEFLKVRRKLVRAVKDEYGDIVCEFGNNSCEDLAYSLAGRVFDLYDVHPSRVAVFEDTFVGAEVIE